MAWIKQGEILAPVNYYAAIHNYNTTRNASSNEILEEAETVKKQLLDIWGDLEGWWISGALNVTLVTKNPQRAHSNTDIIVLDNPNLIKSMSERAKNLGLFATSRISSKVPFRANGVFFPEIKEEKYVLADPEKIAKNKTKNRDYMFCKFDHEGRITQENTPESRIRIFVHSRVPNRHEYLSIEDQLVIPGKYLSSQRILDAEDKKVIRSASIEYMLPIHQETLRRLERSKNRWFNKDHVLKRIEKHQKQIEIITGYLAAHPEYS